MDLSTYKASLFRNSTALLDRVENRQQPLTASEQHELSLDTLTLDLARRAEQTDGILAGLHQQPRQERIFGSLGEQLLAVVRATRGLGLDRRLQEVQRRGALGANEKVGSDGGFLVEDVFTANVWTRMYTSDAVLSQCMRIPLSANKITIPAIDETSRVNGSRWGGSFQAYWADEAPSITAGKPKFKTNNLVKQKVTGLCYVSDDVLENSGFGVFIEKLASMELAFKLALAVIRGTGAGQPLGILSGPGLITQAKETGQAAATIVRQNIVNMWGRLFAGARSTAAWYINQDAERSLYDSANNLKDIFVPAGVNGSRYCSLFGAPVIPIEACSTLGQVGDLILANLGDYIIADRPVDVASSMHVQFLTQESVFRFTLRADGMPLISSPLTPLNGTTTQSSYIALETRS